MKAIKKIMIVGMLVMGLTACATFSEAKKENEIKSQIDRYKNLNNLEVKPPVYTINVDQGVWVSAESMKAFTHMPQRLRELQISVTLGDALPLNRIAALLSKRVGIPVYRSSELIKRSEGVTNMTDPSTLLGGDMQDASSTAESASDDRLTDYIPTGTYRFEHGSISFSDVLDRISAALGISWRYDKTKGVEFYFYDTKTYAVNNSAVMRSLATSSSNESESGGSNGSEGLTGNASQRLETEKKSNFWKEIEDELKVVLTPYGVLNVNEVTGQVTVTDNQDAINRVKHYIDSYNKALDRQVHAQITVISHTVESSDSLSFDLEVVYKKVDRAIASFSNAQLAGDNTFTLTSIDPSSRFNGSSLMVDALSSEGETSVLYRNDYYLRNFTPRQVKVGDTLRYIASATNTDTADVGSSQTAEDKSLFTGTAITIHPHILNDEEMILDMVIANNSLVEFDEQIVDGITVKLPQEAGYDDTPSVRLRNGQARAAVFFEASQLQNKNSGTLGKNNCFAGCDRMTGEKRTYIIVIVSGWVI